MHICHLFGKLNICKHIVSIHPPKQHWVPTGGLVAKSCLTLMTPWAVAHQASLSRHSPGKDMGVGCHFLLQGIFLTQESNPGLLHCRQILYRLSYEGSLKNYSMDGGGSVTKSFILQTINPHLHFQIHKVLKIKKKSSQV